MVAKFRVVDWVRTANIYEVNLRQYTAEGTFNAFRTALPRLANMGVKVLWFMPIQPISQQQRQGTLGSYYACSHYMTTNPEFGTIEDFRALVEYAHELGLKVLIDWVANHTGYDHIWTETHPEFYKKNVFGSPFSEYGWADVIDLDYSNPDLQPAMIEAMSFWIKQCDIDGFRCDMAHLVPLWFWEEARLNLDAIKPLLWLAETEEPHYHQVFDITYAWQVLHKMEDVYSGRSSAADLRQVLLHNEQAFPANAIRLFFTSNHDENSHSGSEFERFGDGAKAFAVLCATWKNALPLVYSGQELPNKKRLKFFDKDEIEWSQPLQYEDFYKRLLDLRNICTALQPGLNDNQIKILTEEFEPKLLCYLCYNQTCHVLVLLNLSSTPNVQFLPTILVEGLYKNVFTDEEIFLSGNVFFQLKDWEYLVFYRNS